MSRIFTFEQIVRKEVPQPQSFHIVLERLRIRLPALPAFHGAIVCGSILMGNPNPWSDLDVLVMHKARHELERSMARQFLASLTEEAYKEHVPISIIPMDIRHAREKRHSLTIGFRSHLLWARNHGGLIGQDPLKEIPDHDSLEWRREEATMYITHCIGSLEKGLLKYGVVCEEKRNTVCHRALDMPFHATRRVLECLGNDCSNIGRGRLIELLSLVAPEETTGRLERINGFLNVYREMLEGQLVHPDEERYKQFLSQFITLINESIEFLRDVGGLV